uniref:Uncharacterized protein n=1 Tax=Chelonoidis abingdonii TaxID=106734 RepID=A0A8C0IQL9_CHEAB
YEEITGSVDEGEAVDVLFLDFSKALDTVSHNGVTPLMAAVCAGGTVGELLAQGARLDAQTDATGETALHLAARFARASAVRSLLDAGADPNVRDRAGRSPLHSAIGADALGACQVSVRGVWMRCGDGNGEPPVLCLALQSLCPTQSVRFRQGDRSQGPWAGEWGQSICAPQSQCPHIMGKGRGWSWRPAPDVHLIPQHLIRCGRQPGDPV